MSHWYYHWYPRALQGGVFQIVLPWLYYLGSNWSPREQRQCLSAHHWRPYTAIVGPFGGQRSVPWETSTKSNLAPLAAQIGLCFSYSPSWHPQRRRWGFIRSPSASRPQPLWACHPKWRVNHLHPAAKPSTTLENH